MAAHWNIQINIQRVSEIPPPAPTYRGITGQKPEKAERVITNVLELKVTADSEAEAYAKAHRMLNANAPQMEQHVHRASCHGPAGEFQCGEYPQA